MVDRLQHYRRIFLSFARINYLVALEYRTDFLLSYVATSFHTVGYLAFLWAVLRQVPAVSGWDFDKMLLLFSANQVMIYLSWALFRYSLAEFYQEIMTGGFDQVLKLPIVPRFTISFRYQNTDLPLPLLTAMALLLFSIRNVNIELTQVLLFVVLFICGLLILYNVLFVFNSLTFWTIEGQDITALVEELFSYSRYPLSLFPTPIAAIFLLLVPILLMVYVPVTALLNILDWRLGLWAIAMVFITYFVSDVVWKLGLRRYSSASS